MAWRTWGFAGFCMLLSISAKNSKEAASTTPENVCWKGSTCWKKGTSSLGMVQIGTKGGTSSMMEKIELENMQDDSGTALAEEKEMERSMKTVESGPKETSEGRRTDKDAVIHVEKEWLE